MAIVTLKDGNAVTLQKMRDAVKNNGFTPREAVITATGTLVQQPGKGPAFRVRGSGEQFTVQAAPKLLEQMRREKGSVTLVGTVASDSQRLRVQSVGGAP